MLIDEMFYSILKFITAISLPLKKNGHPVSILDELGTNWLIKALYCLLIPRWKYG